MVDNQVTTRPVFSLILAFRNEGRFIEGCLKSLDDQTFPREKWEIILVDSCSDDGSRITAENYARRHRNCKLIDNPLKLATAGWNLGVEASSGRYYYPVSGHSINDKDFLTEAAKFLQVNPESYL